MPEWKALNVRVCGSGPKPKNLWQWIQCLMSLRLQSFFIGQIHVETKERFTKDFSKSYGGQAVWGAICKKKND